MVQTQSSTSLGRGIRFWRSPSILSEKNLNSFYSEPKDAIERASTAMTKRTARAITKVPYLVSLRKKEVREGLPKNYSIFVIK